MFLFKLYLVSGYCSLWQLEIFAFIDGSWLVYSLSSPTLKNNIPISSYVYLNMIFNTISQFLEMEETITCLYLTFSIDLMHCFLREPL